MALLGVGSVGALVYANITLPIQETLPLNPGVIQSGQEWQVVYVGNSKCWASNDSRVAPAVRTIVRAVGSQVGSINESLSTLGVATDPDHEAGLRHLEQIGVFDQISLGGIWRNHSLAYLRSIESGIAVATPTLLIVRRAIEITSAGESMTWGDSVVVRLVGIEEIQGFARWVSGEGAGPHMSRDPRRLPPDASIETGIKAMDE